MGFWIFMLLMDLLIPLTMIGFGRYFMKNTPKELNHHRLEAGGFGLAAESSLKLTNLEVIALLSFF